MEQEIQTLKPSGLKIVQCKNCFKFGLDSILLSNFANIKHKDIVIDLCTGNAIIPLMLFYKYKPQKIDALEIQEILVNAAKKSVELNALSDFIQITQGNVKNINNFFLKAHYDVVTANPPYMSALQAKKNLSETKTISRHEVLCTLNDVVHAADYLLKPFGKFFIVHRPSRLVEIFSTLRQFDLEPKRIKFVQPLENEPANIVLIEARKNSNPELKLEPTLNVYKSKGIYSDEINALYERTL